MLCNLQIFSGCVCHLEQLHAQSPFLFPIVFGINLIPFLIPFFDNRSVFAVLSPGLFGFVLLYLGQCAARSQLLLFVVLAGGFGVSPRAVTSNLPSSPDPPIPSQTEVCSTIGQSIQDRRLFTIHCSLRISTSYKFAVPRNRLPCRLFRLSVEPRLSTALKDRSVVR